MQEACKKRALQLSWECNSLLMAAGGGDGGMSQPGFKGNKSCSVDDGWVPEAGERCGRGDDKQCRMLSLRLSTLISVSATSYTTSAKYQVYLQRMHRRWARHPPPRVHDTMELNCLSCEPIRTHRLAHTSHAHKHLSTYRSAMLSHVHMGNA
eukprot:1159584-Pelagomonas_calceolata.AAC.18